MSAGWERGMGETGQYVDAAMCEQKHGELTRKLDDHKDILLAIQSAVNPRVYRTEDGMEANKEDIKELKRGKNRGVDVVFKVIQALGAVGLAVLTLLLVLKKV